MNRQDVLLSLILAKTVLKGYQQTTTLAGKMLKPLICVACEARMRYKDHDSSGEGVRGITLLVSN